MLPEEAEQWVANVDRAVADWFQDGRPAIDSGVIVQRSMPTQVGRHGLFSGVPSVTQASNSQSYDCEVAQAQVAELESRKFGIDIDQHLWVEHGRQLDAARDRAYRHCRR